MSPTDPVVAFPLLLYERRYALPPSPPLCTAFYKQKRQYNGISPMTLAGTLAGLALNSRCMPLNSSEFASPWDPIGMQSRHAVPFYVQSPFNSTKICRRNSIFRTRQALHLLILYSIFQEENQHRILHHAFVQKCGRRREAVR